MAKLKVFNSVSVDGYFTDQRGDFTWAHKQDAEWQAFVAENASTGASVLLFGRVTYQLMASYWPTEAAKKDNAAVAEGMNKRRKVVFSRTLDTVDWENTTIVKGDIVAEVGAMKREKGPDMVILGSGTIVAQLARAGLIDEVQLVMVPIVLGKGRTLFEGVEDRLNLVLEKSRPFKNGNVVLWYRPAEVVSPGR